MVDTPPGDGWRIEGPSKLTMRPNDGLGQILGVQGHAPVLEGLVGGEQAAAALDVAGIEDMEQDIGGVGAVAEIANFVADQHGGLEVGLEGGLEAALAAGARRHR